VKSDNFEKEEQDSNRDDESEGDESGEEMEMRDGSLKPK
jgi:hypothetical protein